MRRDLVQRAKCLRLGQPGRRHRPADTATIDPAVQVGRDRDDTAAVSQRLGEQLRPREGDLGRRAGQGVLRNRQRGQNIRLMAAVLPHRRRVLDRRMLTDQPAPAAFQRHQEM